MHTTLKNIKSENIIVAKDFEELIYALENTKDELISLPRTAIIYMGLDFIIQRLKSIKLTHANVYDRFLLNVIDNPIFLIKGLDTEIKKFLFLGNVATAQKVENIRKKTSKNKSIYVLDSL